MADSQYMIVSVIFGVSTCTLQQFFRWELHFHTNLDIESQSLLMVLKHTLVTKRDSAHITNAKKVIYLSECIYLGFFVK